MATTKNTINKEEKVKEIEPLLKKDFYDNVQVGSGGIIIYEDSTYGNNYLSISYDNEELKSFDLLEINGYVNISSAVSNAINKDISKISIIDFNNIGHLADCKISYYTNRTGYRGVMVKSDKIGVLLVEINKRIEEQTKIITEKTLLLKNACIQHYGEENVYSINRFIYVHFPEITIINRDGLSKLLRDIYIKINSANFTIRFLRTTLGVEELIADYSHSHVQGIANEFKGMCLGSGPFASLTLILRDKIELGEEISEDDIDGWLFLMEAYLTWENTSNPYRYMKNITSRLMEYLCDNDNPFNYRIYKKKFDLDFFKEILPYTTLTKNNNISIDIDTIYKNGILEKLSNKENLNQEQKKIDDFVKTHSYNINITTREFEVLKVDKKMKITTDIVEKEFLNNNKDKEELSFPLGHLDDLKYYLETEVNEYRTTREIENYFSENIH